MILTKQLKPEKDNQRLIAIASIGFLLCCLIAGCSHSNRWFFARALGNPLSDPCSSRAAMNRYLESGGELVKILNKENERLFLSPHCASAIFFSMFDLEQAATLKLEQKAKIIDFLVKYNTKGEFDIYGKIPLLNSISLEDKQMVELLIDKGTNINAANGYGIDALYRAIDRNSLDLVKLIIDNGADVNLKNKDEETPLDVAKSKGYTEVVKYLLERGAK